MLKSSAQSRIKVQPRIVTQATWQRDWPLNLILLGLALITYLPFVIVIISSFKDTRQYFSQFWLPTLPLHFENYSKAWGPIWQSLQNTFLYTAPTLVLVLLLSSLTGYAFARFRFRGREFLFYSILVLLMLPGILLVIPMFAEIVDMKWTNTAQAIILPWTTVQIPFGMFLMRTFFETMPREYFEAARLDGATEFQLFYRIAIPLAVPALSTLGILTLLFCWNDIIWPLIVILDPSKSPVAIGVLSFSSSSIVDYGATFAAFVLASIPLIVIFAFTVRRFMAGLQGSLRI